MRRDGGGRGRQRGIGLIAAIFLIVVVAGLAVAIARMVRTSSDAFAQDLTSHRAYLAAESGAELGLNRVFAPAGASTCGTWNWSFDAVGLRGCQARVSCQADLVDGVPHYTLESAGRCAAGALVAERHLQVRAAP